MDTRPSILVWGEEILDPARRLLRRIDAQIDDFSSRATAEDIEREYALVVMSLAQALELEQSESAGSAGLPGKPVRVVIHNQDFLPLRDRLRRVGVDFLVQMSVDPAVLRLLFLHAIFHGPEKRSLPRLLVGSRVSYIAPEARWPATLVDLNADGCRLLTTARLPLPDTPVTLILPAALAGGEPLELRGRALRAESEAESERERQLALAFDSLDPKLSRRLDALVSGKAIGTLVTRLADAEPSRKLEVQSPRDRRRSARVPYSNIVTALIGDDTRILLGRDLSRAGVRVEPAPNLGVGRALEVAIYGATRQEPVLVPAVVARDDGEHGLLLRFDQAASTAICELDDILRDRAGLCSLTRLDSPGGPVVVTGMPLRKGAGKRRGC
jgi:hypothetical protein